MTTFTHQLLSRKNINPRRLIMRVRIGLFEPQCYGVSCCVALGLCRSGKLDTMWRGAWQRLATRHQEGMWPFQMVTAAGRCFLSHGQKHRNLQRDNLQFTEPNIFPPNSHDLNTVNLPSGVLFSRRSTIIEVSPQLTKWRVIVKAWQKLPHGAVVANSPLFITFLCTVNVIRQMAPLFSKVDSKK